MQNCIGIARVLVVVLSSGLFFNSTGGRKARGLRVEQFN